MLPITLSAAQKTIALLTAGDALNSTLQLLAASEDLIAPISADNIVVNFASADLSDRSIQLGYPRVCVTSSGLRNRQNEKNRSFAGVVHIRADVFSSGNRIEDAEKACQFYVEAMGQLLQQNRGSWGDGFFFGGVYEANFQGSRVGGFGFIQQAQLTFELTLSVS